MLFRSGRIYHSDLLNIEGKLDLIFKKIQDFKLKVERLKIKIKRKALEMILEIGEKRTPIDRDDEDDIIRMIKIDPLIFDDILGSKIFSDWMADLDYYFDCYRFTKECRIRFARMKLTGSVRIYWTSVERVHETCLL